MQEHSDRFMRKVYDDHVAGFRRWMFTLMLQDEPLLEDNSSLHSEVEESVRDAHDASTSALKTEMTASQPSLAGAGSLAASMQNLEAVSPTRQLGCLAHGKTRLELTEEYMALAAIKEKKSAFEKQAEYLQDVQLIEYVKFLIGQVKDADFEIKRVDFAQTHELH